MTEGNGGATYYMRCNLFVIALILILSVGFVQNVVSAETIEENRTVSELLNGRELNEEEPSNEGETPMPTENEAEEEMVGDILPEQNTFLIFVQMISALVLVIVLIYFILRFVSKRSQSFRSSKVLQNVGGVPLGANKSVQLVKVGNRVLVVGVGETIQLLREIEDEAEINSILNHQQEQLEQLDQPISKLMNWVTNRVSMNKSSNKAKVRSPKATPDAFKNLLENQLKDVSKSQEKLHDAVRERDK
jgi:flagellar protein FliO/FliZ